MKRKNVFSQAGILLLSLLLLPGMVGCGAISSLMATPTPTPMPTNTPTPTSTPTPTNTPTSTPSPISLPMGWRDYAISGFHIALPERWKAVDIDKEGIESVLNLLKGLDTEWARNATAMFSAETVREAMKFWAMDTMPAGTGYASANITFQSMPFTMDSNDLCIQMPSVYEQIGFELNDAKCGLEINKIDVAQFTIRLRVGAFAVKQYQYVYMQERSMWTLTLAVDETQWAEYQPLFVDIAETFRIEQ